MRSAALNAGLGRAAAVAPIGVTAMPTGDRRLSSLQVCAVGATRVENGLSQYGLARSTPVDIQQFLMNRIVGTCYCLVLINCIFTKEARKSSAGLTYDHFNRGVVPKLARIHHGRDLP